MSTNRPGAWLDTAALVWLEQVLHERFGLVISIHQRGGAIHLESPGLAGEIELICSRAWWEISSAELPCASWDAQAAGWDTVLHSCLPAPGVSVVPIDMICRTDTGFTINYDLLGLVYWVLARFEEVEHFEGDRYDRFPTEASHAYRHGYLHRPIVDEWLFILRQVVQLQWPELQLRPLHYSMRVSHDVDEPSRYAFKSLRALTRVVAIDVLRHGDWSAPLRALHVKLKGQRRLVAGDPANTFDWLMGMSERYDLKSAFYFICGRTNPAMDADYELEWPAIRALLREIHGRGHEIGLHPSFETYRQAELIEAEVQRLKTVCTEEGVQQAEWGGRMHYLRWAHPLTMRAWEQAGMTYDSTLGYADMPGFRCGTCHEYPAFDPVEGRQLNLRIRPLIAMEVTVMSPTYMGLGQGAEALAQFEALIRACRAVGGCFTLLWHNSNLSTPAERALYERVLELGAVEKDA